MLARIYYWLIGQPAPQSFKPMATANTRTEAELLYARRVEAIRYLGERWVFHPRNTIK